MHEYILRFTDIDKETYLSLKWFSRTYPAKKQAMRDVLLASAPPADGLPRGSGISDPTSAAVQKRERFAHDVDQVETAAKLAAGNEVLARALIRNVAYGENWQAIDPPCGRRQFFEMRQRYFVCLCRGREEGE